MFLNFLNTQDAVKRLVRYGERNFGDELLFEPGCNSNVERRILVWNSYDSKDRTVVYLDRSQSQISPYFRNAMGSFFVMSRPTGSK
jgi:hypothetical protein